MKKCVFEIFMNICYVWFVFDFLYILVKCVEGIHRTLVLGLVLIAGTAIEQAPSLGPQ